MKDAKKGSVIVTEEGEELTVTAVTGRYYICGDRQFRKTNPIVVDVKEPKKADKKEKEDA